MVVVLSGGTGGAKFVQGLMAVVPAAELVLVVNTGDDLTWWGLNVSPDVDSVLYALAGRLSKERGWGLEGDTFHCLEAMRCLGAPHWFNLGDADLATHLQRTCLLASGCTLTEATAEIARGLGVTAKVLPMSDARVETRVTTEIGELAFQEYFVRERCRLKPTAVRFVGAEQARPAVGVCEAILTSDAVLIAPSNPITSIGPILAVPGVKEALCATAAAVVAISPIVGHAPVSGPAGDLMTAVGLPVSAAGVAEAYADFLDLLVVDGRDGGGGPLPRGVRVAKTNTIMSSTEAKAELAKFVVAAARSSTSPLVQR